MTLPVVPAYVELYAIRSTFARLLNTRILVGKKRRSGIPAQDKHEQSGPKYKRQFKAGGTGC